MDAERTHPSDAALVIAAVGSLQFGSAFARTWFDEPAPLGAAALRLAFGALLLLLAVRPRTQGWTRRRWLGAVVLGAALGGMNSCIYLAVSRLDFGIAVTIEFLGPLVMATVSATRVREYAWLAAAFAGVVALGVPGGASLDPVGVLFAVGAATCWATYIGASRRLARGTSQLDGITIAVAVAALVVAPFGGRDAVAAIGSDAAVIPAFLVIAVVTCAFPYASEYVAFRRLPVRVFGVLSSLGPALAAVAGVVILGQRLGIVEWLAVLVVCVASAGAVLGARRPGSGEGREHAHGG
ncbi:MAG: EamA family transporter [Thermoleophilia bacterium]|nr:EamA family transporter [Thermoleophilia bacterium]